MERVWRPEGPLDLHRTLAPLRHAADDPTHRATPDGALWRATRTPDGPASYRLVRSGADVTCAAWGPGAGWVLDGLPDLLGTAHAGPFGHPVLDRAHKACPGIGIPRTRRVFESLVPAVLEQKVTGKQAR